MQQGLTIHFFRSSPKAAANEVKTYPLLLLHGWPASYVEFLEVASILSHPHDGIAFDVIVPSLPGYGYSDAPNRKGGAVLSQEKSIEPQYIELPAEKLILRL